MSEPRRMLTLAQVMEIVPLKRTTIFNLERQDKFPKSHYVTANRRVWYADEIAEWQIGTEEAVVGRRVQARS